MAKDSSGNTVSGASFTWSSDNTGVATVDNTGKATAVAVGMADITASSGGVSGKATLTVTTNIKTVTVTPSSATISVGQTQQFSATATSSSGSTLSGKMFTWASSNTSVATVDSTGKATGVAAGTATISANGEGIIGTATLTVTGASGAAAGTTDSNGMVTVSSGGVTIPVQLTDPVTGSPLQGISVALGLPSSQTGVATLVVYDQSGAYPLQFIPLLSAASPTPFAQAAALRSDSLAQQSSADPVPVSAQTACRSALPSSVTATDPIVTTAVPGPDPSLPAPTLAQIAQAYWQGGTNALQAMALSLGVSFFYTDKLLQFSGSTAASDCKNEILGSAATEGATHLALLGMEAAGAESPPALAMVTFTLLKTAYDTYEGDFSGCAAWWDSVTVRSVQFGNKTLLLVLPYGDAPPSSSLPEQPVTVTPPVKSSLCFVSSSTLGGDFAGATDGSGLADVFLPADTYTVGVTSQGYSPSAVQITVPAPGQPVSPLGVSLEATSPGEVTYIGGISGSGANAGCSDIFSVSGISTLYFTPSGAGFGITGSVSLTGTAPAGSTCVTGTNTITDDSCTGNASGGQATFSCPNVGLTGTGAYSGTTFSGSWNVSIPGSSGSGSFSLNATGSP